jgi:hypothetical protein
MDKGLDHGEDDEEVTYSEQSKEKKSFAAETSQSDDLRERYKQPPPSSY